MLHATPLQPCDLNVLCLCRCGWMLWLLSETWWMPSTKMTFPLSSRSYQTS